MNFSLSNVFSRKNLNLVVGLITLLVVLWVIMFAIPNLFVNLFDTALGNLILIAFIFLAAIYNINLAVGLAIVFIILYRFSHYSSYHYSFEQFLI
jgi:hypothetical protein